MKSSYGSIRFLSLVFALSAAECLMALPAMQVKGSLKPAKISDAQRPDSQTSPEMEEEYLYESETLEIAPAQQLQQRQRLRNRIHWLPGEQLESRPQHRPLSRTNSGHASSIHEWKSR